MTIRSHLIFIIFILRIPIIQHSTHQNYEESAVFGAYFVAVEEEMEANGSLTFKFWLLGTRVEGETNVLSDNMFLCNKSSIPESTVEKFSTRWYIMQSIGRQLLRSQEYVLKEDSIIWKIYSLRNWIRKITSYP